LDFLEFIRPNRDFSKGYEQKNKKNRLASQVVCKTSHAISICLSAFDVGQGRLDPANAKSISRISFFRKAFVGFSSFAGNSECRRAGAYCVRFGGARV
jgi:hypothetical protein